MRSQRVGQDLVTKRTNKSSCGGRWLSLKFIFLLTLSSGLARETDRRARACPVLAPQPPGSNHTQLLTCPIHRQSPPRKPASRGHSSLSLGFSPLFSPCQTPIQPLMSNSKATCSMKASDGSTPKSRSAPLQPHRAPTSSPLWVRGPAPRWMSGSGADLEDGVLPLRAARSPLGPLTAVPPPPSQLCAYLLARLLGLPDPAEQGLALVHLPIAGACLGPSPAL